MSDTKEINIQLPAGYTGGDIILREGKATTPIEEKKVVVNGVMGATSEYIRMNYKDVLDEMKEGSPDEVAGLPGIITFCRRPENLFVKFDEFPANPVIGAVITGSTTKNPDLMAFCINENKFFTSAEIIELVRDQAHNFSEMNVARELITLMRNFEAVFTTERKKADDRRGSTEDAIKDAISFKQGELPKSIPLVIKLFTHSPMPVTVNMEIEIERRGTQAVYGFFCLELEQMMRGEAFSLVVSNTDPFQKLFSVIEIA